MSYEGVESVYQTCSPNGMNTYLLKVRLKRIFLGSVQIEFASITTAWCTALIYGLNTTV